MIMRHPLHFFLLCMCVGVMVPGCATNSPPAWTIGESEKFPSKRYLVGVGEGDSRTVAEERAYAAVARIFEAQIEAEARDSESYSIRERDGASSTSRQLTLDHVTQVSTKKVLENVQVLDTWQQPQHKQFFVLAGMDRLKAEKALRDQISEWDQAIEEEVTKGRTAENKLSKIRGFKRAIKYMNLREDANSKLRIVRVDGSGMASSYRLEELKHELENYLMNNLIVRIKVEGKQEAQIRRALLEGLSREGLLSVNNDSNSSPSQESTNSNNGANADLLIQGTARLWKVDLPDPLFVYVRWCSDLQVIEQAKQRIIGIVSRSGREGHITLEEANARASKVMQAAVTSDVAQTLSVFIYGDVEELSPPSKTACPR